RLLVFAEPAADALARAKDGVVVAVDASPFGGKGASAAAMELARIAPGQVLPVDGDSLAWPQPLSRLPAGDYYVQAVLDVARNNNYGGRGADDLSSTPQRITVGPGAKPATLVLDQRAAAAGDPWQLPPTAPEALRAAIPAAKAATQEIDMPSAALGAFWGRPVHLRGWVVLPPGYDADDKARYPVLYFTHGFGGSQRALVPTAIAAHAGMADGSLPPMIWVLLDESGPTGTHEFADSVNNGPWGTALTEELIPALESRYRMDATANGRFLNGHSSGGWATLWLQVRYPKLFGGTWSTAPDSSDFRDFSGIDLYAADANVYRKPDGTAWPLMRDKGQVVASFEQFARLEEIVGPVGGQLASFEWVFSPRGADGRPMPMFDRGTGQVDPMVVAYWRTHYDIAERIRRDWPRLKPDLDGKLHVYVGTADTFYLDGGARKLKDTLDAVGARADFRFVPDRTHFDLYVEGDDRRALLKDIAWQMYTIARPGSKRPPAPAR
ncbi:MAG: enterochelin esterase, partial [Xanthomonadales bacterium]|nr:enterochelin esterase [Xanthomonadales bacterium]